MLYSLTVLVRLRYLPIPISQLIRQQQNNNKTLTNKIHYAQPRT